MQDDELDEVVNEFITESHENLDQLDRGLVVLEHNPDKDVIARIFRTIHTIKGTSAFLGFGTLEAITHVGENLLSKLRDGELSVTTEITTELLAMVDAVREILDAVATTRTEGSTTYEALVERLGRLNRGEQLDPSPVTEVEVVAEVEVPIEVAVEEPAPAPTPRLRPCSRSRHLRPHRSRHPPRRSPVRSGCSAPPSWPRARSARPISPRRSTCRPRAIPAGSASCSSRPARCRRSSSPRCSAGRRSA